MHLAMLSGVFAFSWSKWSASPTLGRWQFVMRAAEWVGQGQSKRSEGACDRGEGYGAVVPEVMTRSRRGRGGERCGPIEYWTLMI